jgi:hypothetical protein
VSLPFKTARSLLLVTVTVDGRSKTLVFDTGAERTLIQDTRNVEHVSTLIVGSKTFRNIPIAYVDLTGTDIAKAHADGVLGQDVLRQFDTMHVNYKTHTITLE